MVSRGVDLATVRTLADLADAFQQLRGSRSYAALDRAVNPSTSRTTRLLPPATLNNLLHAKSVPKRETTVIFLAACGLDEREQAPWLRAWERVATAELRRPVGATRVHEARPRLLGVHPAIQVDGVSDELPTYVRRDFDTELHAQITTAAECGGFVLLVGGSSVGKTRALLEAIRTAVPEWWLVQPDHTAPEALRDLAVEPTPRTVVWLDEFQRFLDPVAGLSTAIVRNLVTSRSILLGTMWPDEFSSRVASRKPGVPDLHANDREVLGLAHVIDVPDNFSVAERSGAEALTADPRIRIALDNPDAGFTQVLAGGPELLRWWENASDPYGKAVITAALDARRVGCTAPLTREFLEAAAPGYLSSAHQAAAPTGWLGQALEYATTVLRGATSTLVPVAAAMGSASGYLVADYLHQHASRTRRTVPLPATVWRALAEHHDTRDRMHLAASASRRGRQQEAEMLIRRAAEDGDQEAAYPLARLFASRGKPEDALALLDMLPADDHRVRDLAAWLLNSLGRTEDLTRLAAHDPSAAAVLIKRLAERGELDQALAHFRRSDNLGAGMHYAPAIETLVTSLVNADRIGDAVEVAEGGLFSDQFLASLLVERDRIADLGRWANTGHPTAESAMAQWMATHGQTDRLREIASSGNAIATFHLSDLLAAEGRFEEASTLLRSQAETGHEMARGIAKERLAKLELDRLVSDGRTDEALALVHADTEQGNQIGFHRIVDQLLSHDRVEEAISVLRQQLDRDPFNYFVQTELARLLAKEGRFEELSARSESHPFVTELARALGDQGRIESALALLRPLADGGDLLAARQLCDLLADHGLREELKAEIAAGTPGAVEALLGLPDDSRR